MAVRPMTPIAMPRMVSTVRSFRCPTSLKIFSVIARMSAFLPFVPATPGLRSVTADDASIQQVNTVISSLCKAAIMRYIDYGLATLCQDFSRSKTWGWELESRLPVGSSATSTGGSFANARAIATRCCCPPESSPGSRLVQIFQANQLEAFQRTFLPLATR